MGGGSYSYSERSIRATNAGYFDKPREEIFQQRKLSNDMDPRGINIRESRDSQEHPNSVAIILGLDVTGSMRQVPHYLVQHGLPNIMARIIQNGVPDPQLLFLAIGDHECDSSPLQVGQFESSDPLLDKWLTSVFLEGGGGGNAGESYLLAWYFAANHTSIDCFEKRKQKGFLFTIGDEPTLQTIPSYALILSSPMTKKNLAITCIDHLEELKFIYHGEVTQFATEQEFVEEIGDILHIFNIYVCRDGEHLEKMR